MADMGITFVIGTFIIYILVDMSDYLYFLHEAGNI